jgi:hypothetical protein
VETIQIEQTMVDDMRDEVETLPEYSLPRVNFVVVLPMHQKEVFSESAHIKKLQEDQEQRSKKEESQTKDIPVKKKQLEEAKSRTSGSHYSPRRFFTDGWNSLWHFVFGVFAIKFKLLVPLFIFYQCLDIFEYNIFIDIWEFLLGYIFGYAFYMI